MATLRPSAAFACTALDLTTVAPGTRFGRIYHWRYPDPLGIGKTPSRFSDPRRRIPANRFGVLYLGSSLKVCFVEAVLRDQRNGAVTDYPIEERELHERLYADVEVAEPLSLVDLRGDGPLRMGVPSDVARGARQRLARLWSVAFHTHPSRPDGIYTPLVSTVKPTWRSTTEPSPSSGRPTPTRSSRPRVSLGFSTTSRWRWHDRHACRDLR